MILVENALIITQNEKRGILKGDILIEENKILKVGKIDSKTKRRVKNEGEVIEGKNKAALPGLVNSHTHLAMTLLRGYADDMELHEWLTTKIWPLESKLKPNDIYNGARLGILEMIKSGTTSFKDMYFIVEETSKACEEMNMRANLSLVFFDHAPELVKRAFGRIPKKTELISRSMGPHAIYTVGEENLLRAKEKAQKEGMKIQMHLSETRKEVHDCKKKTGLRPVEYLQKIGFLYEDFVAFHVAWVNRREISILGKSKVSSVHCPISNLKLATGGFFPMPEMLEDRINIALGTDGASSNNSLNMWETMKMASLLQKFARWDASLIKAQQALDFATRNGADALGFNSGRIEEGRLADIILLNLDENLRPVHNVVSNLVYSTHPGNVNDSIINGKIVMRDRKVENEEEILRKAEYSEKWDGK